MHSSLKAVAAVVALSSTFAFAQPQGEVVIRTRSGTVRMGRVLSETSTGYLLSGPDGTAVVPFADVVDIRQLAPSGSPAAAAAPAVAAPAPVTAAPAYQPAAAPAYQPAASALPPLPTEPATSYQVETAEEPSEGRSREGLHLGLGADLMATPYGGLFILQGHFEANFGRPVYRLSLNLGLGYGLLVSVNNMFQFNANDVYAFGVGLQLGLVAVNGYGIVYPSLVLQPAIIKLGDRGQHQLSLTLALGGLSYGSVGYAYLF